jgi:hypothetical protein
LDKDQLASNIEAAIKQWVTCTSTTTLPTLPKAGPGNPNDGAGKDPAVMGPGSTHAGGGKGKKFRSLTARECDGMLLKYPKGLAIRLIKDGAEAEGDIVVGWGVPGAPNAKGIGPSESAQGDPDKTGSAQIGMHPQDAKVKWHLAKDVDSDGFITNKDDDKLPSDEYDFYSVFKHEVGHVLCFNHAGENLFHDSQFGTALRLDGNVSSNGEHRSPFATSVGDDFENGRESIIFSSDRSGGYGGFDLWIATWTDDGWRVANLGPAVNSAANEMDPHLASDGTLLLFSSNRGATEKLFHLYQSSLDLAEGQWRTASPIEVLNSTYEERHPSLTANMRGLYFASNRPGGAGGWDIWASEWIPGIGFSSPFNLGAPINTARNEIAPAISGDGALLVFSSDRSGGFGGYDLWSSSPRPVWTTPVNLGSTVNTSFDENEPSLRVDHDYLVFASNRPGGPAGWNIFESRIASVPLRHFNWLALLVPVAIIALIVVLLTFPKRRTGLSMS